MAEQSDIVVVSMREPLVVDSPLAPRPLEEPSARRLPLDHPSRAQILERHHTALERGQDGYIDPDSGLFVFTAAYHAARGTCCESGCRHCPYVS